VCCCHFWIFMFITCALRIVYVSWCTGMCFSTCMCQYVLAMTEEQISAVSTPLQWWWQYVYDVFSDAGDVPYYHLRCLIATLQLLIWAVNIVCFVIMLCNTKELFGKAKTSMWNAMQIHEIRLQMLLSWYMCILESSFCPSHFLHVYALLV